MLFDVLESERSGWIVLAVVGEFDLASAPRVRQAILRSIGSSPAEGVKLLLDLSGVDFIDSSGLGVLIGAKRRVGQAGGSVRVVVREPQVRAVFDVTDLDRVFDLFETVDGALHGDDDRSGHGDG